MPIDDLASQQALQRFQMEDLSDPPALASSFPKIGLAFVKALLTGDPSEIGAAFDKCHDALGAERSQYLVRCVVDDLKYLRDRLEGLPKSIEEYLSTHFIPLYFDADKKARETRAKTRIERIAQILCASIRIEPIPAADETEEMMRIATELTDHDVLVLKELQIKFDHYMRNKGHFSLFLRFTCH